MTEDNDYESDVTPEGVQIMRNKAANALQGVDLVQIDPLPYAYKQVLVLRTDLKMRRGKEIAQGAHASLKVVLENMDHPHVLAWLGSRFAKIAVGADSDMQMFDLLLEAEKRDIITTTVIDAGFTEFNGVPTLTALAIGPGPVDIINEITGHLKLR